jgi:hypothetical protein
MGLKLRNSGAFWVRESNVGQSDDEDDPLALLLVGCSPLRGCSGLAA